MLSIFLVAPLVQGALPVDFVVLPSETHEDGIFLYDNSKSYFSHSEKCQIPIDNVADAISRTFLVGALNKNDENLDFLTPRIHTPSVNLLTTVFGVK